MKLWMMRLDRPLTPEEEQALAAVLPSSRLERLDRQRDPDHRRETLCAYGLLARMLREFHGLEVIPRIARSEQGKPWFPDDPTLCFSLSHTEEAVFVGLADRPLGVDIQRIRPVGERLLRQLSCDSAEEFFPQWVRREARAKRMGGSILTLVRREPPLEPEELVQMVGAFPGYVACVSVVGEAVPQNLRQLTLDELFQET